jgi:hypothetical protein
VGHGEAQLGQQAQRGLVARIDVGGQAIDVIFMVNAILDFVNRLLNALAPALLLER